ncbi:hypothetical protein SKAU_G00283270 [Synaphobranchus kaupii]|uniref:Uncharacterized protein n=1 Tax=Synaphobranchus kaupii TaxID=118154 RepID=A0A9Q1EXI7_SYNKA|nr:hypothetical protein SKAU_G00283270 [Synaphobranchus kaupii]
MRKQGKAVVCGGRSLMHGGGAWSIKGVVLLHLFEIGLLIILLPSSHHTPLPPRALCPVNVQWDGTAVLGAHLTVSIPGLGPFLPEITKTSRPVRESSAPKPAGVMVLSFHLTQWSRDQTGLRWDPSNAGVTRLPPKTRQLRG